MLRRLLERWRFGRRPQTPADPLQTFDRLIAGLERQGATFRQGAATLLSLRTQLREGLMTARAQAGEVRARWEAARALDDGERVTGVLALDLEALERQVEAGERQLARADADAALLLEGARSVQEELSRLQAERHLAVQTLTMDRTVSQTLRARLERLEASPALDAARDEVARAHALAEIYREGG